MNARVLIETKPSTTSAPPVRSNLLQRKCACGGTSGPTGECDQCKRRRLVLQPKLAINKPGDRYEQEADRVAEAIVRGGMSRAQAIDSLDEGTAVQRDESATPQTKNEKYKVAAKNAGEEETLQRKAADNHTVSGAPESLDEVLHSSGLPIDAGARRFFEGRFGYDFGHVRIHADGRAAQSARAVNALAYTVGHDIVFAAGQYAPESETGKRLLAHELVHVLQNTMLTDANQPLIQRAEAERDDDAVQAYIDKALEQNSNDVDGASLSLMARRNKLEDCGDENLAAAEHYMFARYLVGELYVPAGWVAELVAGYALFKIGNYWQYAFINWILGACQATPVSAFQVKWGLKGVLAGKADKNRKSRWWRWTPW